jgi:AraC family transcriptional regulator of adaptative response/methylated-DNA-[protein]-cysteine methyltransferase
MPRQENVLYFSTVAEAQGAGLRPCKRCNPDGESPAAERAAKIAKACRLLDQAEGNVSMHSLAGAVNLSSWYFHRLFTRLVGLTPKQYAQAVRAERVRKGLAAKQSVTETIYEAGYSSSSRFYSDSTRILGMQPTTYKAGAAGESIRWAVAPTSLGTVLVAASGRGICAVLLGDNPASLSAELLRRFPSAQLKDGGVVFQEILKQVIHAVDEPRAGIRLPLDIRGTAFQQRVWQKLIEIPIGSTVSYAEVARKIGKPKAARAVAQACASNNIAVLIPCHRVVRGDGTLSGYRWGVERKSELLRRERNSGKSAKTD